MNANAIALLITLLLGFIVFVVLIPHDNRAQAARELRRFRALSEAGGYVHDTNMSTYIPPTCWHFATASMTQVAGQVAGTIALHRAANNETSVVSIPVMLPSNAAAGKGAYLKSIEVDYEVLAAEPTSITWTLNKVTRAAEGADAAVAAVTQTQAVAAAAAKTVDEHRQVITLTTPVWIDNDEYFLLQAALVAGAGGSTEDFLAAVANWTLRV
jgi:hypothetical protein